MNDITATYLLRNRNANDLGGQLAIASGGTKPLKTLGEINSLLKSSNLPTLVEYDEGYYDENGTYQKWIPTDKLSIVGARSNGDRLGEYRMVKNVNNPDSAPGRYEKVIDHLDRKVPRMIEVHRGHNGGPVVYYGSAIVQANV